MARPLSSFCLHRIRSGGTASTAAPPSICANKEASSGDGGEICKSLKDEKQEGDREEANKKGGVEAVVVGRKVMVAADGCSEEARTALQWALSHAVRPCDTVVLLDVVRGGGGNGKTRRDPRGSSSQHLEAMRSICQAKRPEVRVELSLAEGGGKDRGPAIVEAARKQGVSLLVVGQKKRSSVTWRLLSMWIAGVKGGAGCASAADYCVQHAACMALAVRRKSRRGGGYLITTRRQRDFWLLA
ncbi:universal stress protein PHOS32-like [Miscanthus floridulus]|uniref:universal stress protein PHOS32-like n=1 Tax=Miscanthus floridulus TaxID=154761 RepID=UPI00345A8B49